MKESISDIIKIFSEDFFKEVSNQYKISINQFTYVSWWIKKHMH